MRRQIRTIANRYAVHGAVVRVLIYVGLGRRSVDERGFEVMRRLRTRYGDMPLSEFETLVREQFAMLLIDQQAALAAPPSLLQTDAEKRSEAFNVIRQVMAACGEIRWRTRRGSPTRLKKGRNGVVSGGCGCKT